MSKGDSHFHGFGLSQPPEVPITDTAAFLFPQIAVARSECDNAVCLKRHAQRGLSHGAFLYELRWGIVEHAGILLTAVAIHTHCHQCGTAHAHVEVPHLMKMAPNVQTS